MATIKEKYKGWSIVKTTRFNYDEEKIEHVYSAGRPNEDYVNVPTYLFFVLPFVFGSAGLLATGTLNDKIISSVGLTMLCFCVSGLIWQFDKIVGDEDIEEIGEYFKTEKGIKNYIDHTEGE